VLRPAVASLVLLCATVAHAEPANNVVVAEDLFREGRALLEAGDTAQACAKLAESHRLDPRMGTLMNLAACHEMSGKVATAWAEFLEAARMARGRGSAEAKRFEEVARGRADALADKIPRLALVAREGVTIRVDGREVPPVAWSSSPIDPGPHLVEASAAGRAPFRRELSVPEGPGSTRVEIPELARLPNPPAPAGAPALGAAPGRSLGPVFWSATALAVIGASAGTFFGVSALDAKSERDAACTPRGCTPAGLAAQDDAFDRASIATVAAGVAIVATAVAILAAVRRPASRTASTVTGR